MRRYLMMIFAAFAIQPTAQAQTITSINVSTVFGYGDTHYPTSIYPGSDRFSILGAAFSYTLSDGQTRSPGAGWIPYTNGRLSSVSVENGFVKYEFDRVNNWAKGEGTIFYSLGQVLCQTCFESGAGAWTEIGLVPVSPIFMTAQLGSTTATLSGSARIAFNNATNNWSGRPESFISLAAPEGSVVPYSATYSLTDGTVWDQNTFDKMFSYNMYGTINVQAVPEPTVQSMYAIGLGLALIVLVRRRSAAIGTRQC